MADVGWRPQPGPQTRLLTCPVFEVFYGGSRGGGKTDGSLGEWLAHQQQWGEHASGLMVRRQRTELVDTIKRSKELYPSVGAKFHEQDKAWSFPNGAQLRFAYLENDSDAEAYQGHSYTRVYGEEIGNFPSPDPIMKLMATLRSAHGVPCGFRGTGNPGGPGHGWVKARYIDPAPLGYEIITTEFRNPFTGRTVTRDRVFIPARLSDNTYLGDDYVATLSMVGSAELVRAWLEGDWNVIAGAFFAEFTLARHVIEPMEIPEHWVRYRAMDWGSARPFCVLWIAVSDGCVPGIPAGCLVVYREWYGMARDKPNVGLKLTAEEVADGILEREAEKIDMSVLDPAAFARDGGPSIAERMAARRVHFHPADNSRVGKRGAMGGWDVVRQRLKGDDRPMLLIASTCTHLIRTLPMAQHDPRHLEDVDSSGEDHAIDALRYGCLARPWVRAEAKQDQTRFPVQSEGARVADIIAERARLRRGNDW